MIKLSQVNSNSYIYSDDAYTSGVKRIPVWRQSIWIKRTKWAAAQALMIGLNFAQYELVSTFEMNIEYHFVVLYDWCIYFVSASLFNSKLYIC